MFSYPRDPPWNIDVIQVVLTTVTHFLKLLNDADAEHVDADADADHGDAEHGDADAVDGDGDENDAAGGAVKCGAVVVLMQAGAKNFYDFSLSSPSASSSSPPSIEISWICSISYRALLDKICSRWA